MSIKVGDLVKVLNDDDGLFGHGVVLNLYPLHDEARVRWFDNWENSEPIEIENTGQLVVISES
tara:strand:- start:75 stop:263 length:189 start_codon:yes stop_codon:yes gene_type:complete